MTFNDLMKVFLPHPEIIVIDMSRSDAVDIVETTFMDYGCDDSRALLSRCKEGEITLFALPQEVSPSNGKRVLDLDKFLMPKYAYAEVLNIGLVDEVLFVGIIPKEDKENKRCEYCDFLTTKPNGWVCKKHNKVLKVEEYKNGCPDFYMEQY